MLYHHSYYGVSPLPLPNVISFTTTISTTSASLYHSCILDHCFFGLPLFVWTTTTLWIATIFLDYRCIYVSNKAVCDPNFRFLFDNLCNLACYLFRCNFDHVCHCTFGVMVIALLTKYVKVSVILKG